MPLLSGQLVSCRISGRSGYARRHLPGHSVIAFVAVIEKRAKLIQRYGRVLVSDLFFCISANASSLQRTGPLDDQHPTWCN
jgi:hypothetical protein